MYENTVKQYIEYARKLHLKLVAPLESFLTPELIIIPSNELANIPFEALLGGAPKDPSNFKTYPFLLRRYTIHYAYSATMLQQMQERKHRQTGAGGILAFAPFFEQDSSQLSIADGGDLRSGLSPLPFSGAEVLTLKKRFGATSQILLGKSATKSQFLAQSGGFQILHLATHGKANHLAGEFSYLAFAGDKTHPDNGLLSVGELYNCALNADLVVL